MYDEDSAVVGVVHGAPFSHVLSQFGTQVCVLSRTVYLYLKGVATRSIKADSVGRRVVSPEIERLAAEIEVEARQLKAKTFPVVVAVLVSSPRGFEPRNSKS